jgi:hypothetical protein
LGNNEKLLGVWLNGKQLSFEAERDRNAFVIERASLNLVVKVNRETDDLDAYQLTIVVGGDGSLPGYEITMHREKGVMVCDGEFIKQLAGQRLIGYCPISICYRGKPLPGFSTEVTIVPNPEVIKMVELMRNTLKQANAVVLDFYGLTREPVDFQNDLTSPGESDPGLEQFLLIDRFYRDAYPFFRAGSERLENVLVRTENQATLIQINRAEHLSAYELAKAYRKGGRFRKLSDAVTSSNVLNPISIDFFPEWVSDPRPCLSFDTLSNRQALFILHQILTGLKKVTREVQQEIKRLSNRTYYGGYAIYVDYQHRRLQNVSNRCQQILAEVEGKTNLLLTMGVKPVKSVGSVRGRLNPIYASLITAFDKYQKRLMALPHLAMLDESSHPLQTRSVEKLYEIWVMHLILKVMLKRLGFILNDNISRNLKNKGRPPLNYILRAGQSVELISPLGHRTVFHYGKLYPSLDSIFSREKLGAVSRKIAGELRPTKKDNPDIAIEFYKSQDEEPKIIMLDATFSNHPEIHRKKNYYQCCICYRPTLDAPRSKWKLPVREALAVHPYFSGDELPLWGEWTLVPNDKAEDDACDFLSNLFKRHELI